MRLVGYLGGEEVNFDFFPPNQYKAEVPKRLDGVYIIELKAIDDAGNVSNSNNVFIKIDYNKMNVAILPKSYVDEIKESELKSELNIEEEYRIKVLPVMSFNVNLLEYSYEELII